MGSKDQSVETDAEKYELQPPDGGWGYMVVIATTVVFISTIIPMAAFGLIFGHFLQTIGDETTGTTMSNGIFNTVNSFMGLVANGVLNKFSYRKVGVAGSIIYFMGALGVVFVKDLFQLVLFFGVIQGIGFGLLMPSTFSALNSYFNKRMALMMSLSQAAMVAGNMSMPPLATWAMETFGFRGTLVILAGLSLLCLPAALTLQPVKWHMKKVLRDEGSTVVSIEYTPETKKSLPSDLLKTQIEPFINQEKTINASQKSLFVQHEKTHHKPRYSVVSLGDRVASVINVNDISDEEGNDDDACFWSSLLQSMDMSLLKDPRYLNMSIGLALCFTADIAFISIIPLMLGNIGFYPSQIALMMSVYFGSDLVSRILLSILSGMVKFNSRVLVMCGAIFSAVFRIILVSNDTYLWKLSALAVLGFLRCFIQTPLALVIAEEYSDKFSTAFSLYMAVNGVVSLIFGPLMSFVKSYTQSDVMVCHILSLAFLLSCTAWTVEMCMCKKNRTQYSEEDSSK